MKKMLTVLFSLFLILGFAGISGAGFMPFISTSMESVETFLNSNYFGAYTEIRTDLGFSGEWWYTAIAFESGDINYTSESPGGTKTFTTEGKSVPYPPGNFGTRDTVNFDTDNLYFFDGDPDGVPLNAFTYIKHHGVPLFRIFQLVDDSIALDYLTGNPVFAAGTFIIGFNDDGLGGGGFDFDGIIVAMAPTPTHAPEPATMLLLGTGLIGLAGLRRRFKK